MKLAFVGALLFPQQFHLGRSPVNRSILKQQAPPVREGTGSHILLHTIPYKRRNKRATTNLRVDFQNLNDNPKMHIFISCNHSL